MSTEVSVSSSPILFRDELSIGHFQKFAETFLGDYAINFKLNPNSNGTYSFECGNSDVGDSFSGRLKSLADACGEVVEKPFYFELTNCETGHADERCTLLFAGPNPESISALEQAVVLESVIENLRGSGLSHLAKPLQLHYESVKDYLTHSCGEVSIPFGMKKRNDDRTRYFRSLLTMEVISEGAPCELAAEPGVIQYSVAKGICFGSLLSTSVMELSPNQIRSALESRGEEVYFETDGNEGDIPICGDH